MPTRHIARLTMLVALLAWPAVGFAQQSDDDALDRLLEQLEEQSTPADPESGDEPKSGEVSSEDRQLDSLLEKLGGVTDEKPAPNGRPALPAIGPDGQPLGPDAKGEGDGPKNPDNPNQLGGKEKDLDEHLIDILGRKRNDDQEQGGDPSGPLAEAIKKMREVRKRLSDTDTGEETRKTQDEVISELDQILEQLRKANGQGQGQGQKMSRMTRQAGLKPGQQPGQPGQQPGNNGQGVGPQQPLRPTNEESLANRKDIWGDLPPQLREEMDNIFKEEMLPSKRDLITRYFSVVAEKGQSSGGGQP